MNAGVRSAVLARAGWFCECGCGAHLDRGEVDHFFGRAKADETVETCWVLTPRCHFAKTNNSPDAGTWFLKFLKHAANYGYVESYKRAAAAFDWYASKKGKATD